MPRGRRKVENPATASRILAAAEQHFAAEGMAGARTDEIAAAAHANKAMLYYYFGNKRRLHRAVLENLFRQLHGKSIPPPHAKGGRPNACAPSCRDISIFWPRIPIIRGWCSAKRWNRAAISAGSCAAICALFTINWCARFEEGIAAGEFRPVDPDHTALSILGMTTSYFAAAPIMSEVVGRNLLAPQSVAARKRALMDFLDHGLHSTHRRASSR